jgi:hypothetical protein
MNDKETTKYAKQVNSTGENRGNGVPRFYAHCANSHQLAEISEIRVKVLVADCGRSWRIEAGKIFLAVHGGRESSEHSTTNIQHSTPNRNWTKRSIVAKHSPS